MKRLTIFFTIENRQSSIVNFFTLYAVWELITRKGRTCRTRGLCKFDGPVCVVEELFPASVSVVVKVDVEGWVSSWFFGFFDERHLGLYRSAAAFPDVAGCAGANDIFPGIFSAEASWDDMVEGKL